MKINASPLDYYSQYDEDSYFERLGRIPSVVSYRGVGHQLEIEFDEKKVNAEDCRELIALFCRYRNSLAPLRQLAKIPGNEWINNKQGFWYGEMFAGE
jgi:hypothetical protein